MKISEIPLSGTIIGFEEYEHYSLRSFVSPSPFRILTCLDAPISFLVVNPFSIVSDYSFEVDDHILDILHLKGDAVAHLAALCIARLENSSFFANLRSPLIINTKEGAFRQVILPYENYGVSMAFTV